jgi:integrase
MEAGLNIKHKITQEFLKTVERKDKLYRIYDTILNGFVLRVQPTGTKTFYFEYRNVAGANKSYKVGRLGNITLAQARDIAGKKSAEVQLGIDIQATKKQDHASAKTDTDNTLSSFMESKYEDWATTHLSNGKQTIDRIKANFSHLLPCKLSDIDVSVIVDWRTGQIKKGKKLSTINRDVNCLYSALSKAVTEWKIIPLHPLLALKPLKLDDLPTPRCLADDEVKRLSTALNEREELMRAKRASGNKWRIERHLPTRPEIDQEHFVDHLKPMVILSLHTGIRRGEMFKLSWDDISFDTNTLTVKGPKAKSKKTRHIPLNPIAKSVLEKWKEQQGEKSGLVFPNKDGDLLDNISTSWGNLMKAAKIEKFRWHDLRHDFASKLVMAGVPLNTVRELMGHSDIKMTLRYAHLAPDHKADAVNKLVTNL